MRPTADHRPRRRLIAHPARTFSYGKYCANTTQPMPPPFKDNAEATATIKRFYQACHDVSERLMELFALALEVGVAPM